MNWIVANIKWIMLVSGVLTFTMIYAAFAPQAALNGIFGDALHGPVADIVVRNWGALIALTGAMLIYGAFSPPVRSFAIAVAVTCKVIFIGLVLSQGGRFLEHQAGVAVAGDAVIVALFIVYLLAVRRVKSTA
jgi:hypothetical protein